MHAGGTPQRTFAKSVGGEILEEFKPIEDASVGLKRTTNSGSRVTRGD